MASVESYYRVSNLVSTPGGHIEVHTVSEVSSCPRSMRVQFIICSPTVIWRWQRQRVANGGGGYQPTEYDT